jgi:hypothetical protein
LGRDHNQVSSSSSSLSPARTHARNTQHPLVDPLVQLTESRRVKALLSARLNQPCPPSLTFVCFFLF